MSTKERCGAKTKSGTPCRSWAMDNGRCRMHGGTNTGAPKGNKNALKHGEHETIFYDTLDEEEQGLWSDIRTDALAQVNEQIRLTVIRMRRMMNRLQELQQHDFTTIERSYKSGMGPEGPVDYEETKDRATLGQIQDIEDAITRVQGKHHRLLKLKHQILEGTEGDDEKIEELLTKLDNIRSPRGSYQSPDI